jgi:hypothetical protein
MRRRVNPRRLLGALLLAGIASQLAACSSTVQTSSMTTDTPIALDVAAEQYVKLALALRPFDNAYVDAYFGPEAWAEEAAAREVSLDALMRDTDRLLDRTESIDVGADTAIVRARKDGLVKRLRSMRLRMAMAAGERLPFDRESAVLFDATVPTVAPESYRSAIDRIAALVPGSGELAERLEAFRGRMTIPPERLADVFDAAIAECRRRTLEHIALPDSENFTLEYVTDQPWSGYNWYQGDQHSLIQINTDLPIFIDRAVDLGCHEGYPGHHTYNVLTEQRLVRERGWVEFTLGPLFGPLSLISEGSANYGIELAFSDEERRAFERNVLAPLAGLDPAEVDVYHDLRAALNELDGVEIAIARRYLDGTQARDVTIEQLREFALSSEERATQRLSFVDTYRSYIINYTYGQNLVADYVAREAGDDRAARWRVFEELLSRPASPSDLR